MNVGEIKELIEKFNNSKKGYAFYYPRLRKISINGFPAKSEKEMIVKIKRLLESL